MIPAGARCGTHATVAAVDVCKRCGRFLCGDCLELIGEDPYCGDCVGKLEKPASPVRFMPLALAVASPLSLGAIFATGVGLFGLGVPLFALAAFVSGVIVFIRMSIGATPARGRGWVIAGLVLGFAMLALSAVQVKATR